MSRKTGCVKGIFAVVDCVVLAEAFCRPRLEGKESQKEGCHSFFMPIDEFFQALLPAQSNESEKNVGFCLSG